MTVFMEECLYVCAHLGWVRKGDKKIERLGDVRSNWGRHEEGLYINPIKLVLCVPLNGKKGRADAQDEDSI